MLWINLVKAAPISSYAPLSRFLLWCELINFIYNDGPKFQLELATLTVSLQSNNGWRK